MDEGNSSHSEDDLKVNKSKGKKTALVLRFGSDTQKTPTTESSDVEKEDGEDEDEEEMVAEEEKDDMSRESADPFADTEDEDDEEEERPTIRLSRVNGRKSSRSIPISECLEGDQIRLKSLCRHRRVLQPFLTEKIYNKLTSLFEEKDFHNRSHRILDNSAIEIEHPQPPTVVNCAMRCYQLEGLNWLIQQYDQRINSVLGDEMGLGSKNNTENACILAYTLKFCLFFLIRNVTKYRVYRPHTSCTKRIRPIPLRGAVDRHV